MVSCVFCGRSYNESSIKKNITFHRVPRKASISSLWLNFGQKEHGFIQSQFNKSSLVCSLNFEKELFTLYNKSVRLKENSVPSIVVHRVKHAKDDYPELLYNSSTSLNIQQTAHKHNSFEESMIMPKESLKINLNSNHQISIKTTDQDLSSSHIEGINELPNSNECTPVKNEEFTLKRLSNKS
ncbi:hypothetical protein ACI65C_013855 [Semiaphis heraclei]